MKTSNMTITQARAIVKANDTSSHKATLALRKAQAAIKAHEKKLEDRKTKAATKKVVGTSSTKPATKSVKAAKKTATQAEERITFFSTHGYDPLGNNQNRGAFTAAAMVVAKYVELNGETLKSGKMGAGFPDVFKAITSANGGKVSSAWNYWRKLFSDDGRTLTEQGQVKLAKRLGSKLTYNTNMDLIKQMVKAMQTGGTHEIGGVKLKFSECKSLPLDMYEGKGLGL